MAGPILLYVVYKKNRTEVRIYVWFVALKTSFLSVIYLAASSLKNSIIIMYVVVAGSSSQKKCILCMEICTDGGDRAKPPSSFVKL